MLHHEHISRNWSMASAITLSLDVDELTASCPSCFSLQEGDSNTLLHTKTGPIHSPKTSVTNQLTMCYKQEGRNLIPNLFLWISSSLSYFHTKPIWSTWFMDTEFFACTASSTNPINAIKCQHPKTEVLYLQVCHSTWPYFNFSVTVYCPGTGDF